ncbi:MAG: DUF882 domain-containing protein [Polyangiaceae bacterium]
MALAIALAAIVAAVAAAAPARADVIHVVQHGHTIEAIAHRYHVTVKAIIDANHLKDPKHLKPGQALVIPGVDGPKKKAEKPTDKAEKAAHETGHTPPPRMAAAKENDRPEHLESGTVHAVRLGEEFRIRMRDAHGHLPPNAIKAFEHLMRQGNAMHAPDPRLLALVGIVSNHFGNKVIEVVSGYRAYTPTQYSPHSNHNYGRALDFRIRGVSNESLRDFCRTLRSAGCGYYPNSTFVHLDVRDTKAYWVDRSRPGEPPKYDKPGVAADEGARDVPTEANEVPDESEKAGGAPEPSPAISPRAKPSPGSIQ